MKASRIVPINPPVISGPRRIPTGPVLGAGTVWMGGRAWEEKNYVPPTRKEVFSYLEKAYAAGIRMFDTASSYGNAEQMLGDFFKDRPDLARDCFFTTKWGEIFNAADGAEGDYVTDNSMTNFSQSVMTSAQLLPKIDLLYFHRPDVNLLRCLDLKFMLADFQAEHLIGYTGVSASKPEVLQKFLDEKVLWPDVLQTSGEVVWTRPDLIQRARDLGKLIVINRPVRAKPQDMSIEEALSTLAANPDIFAVITGTRNPDHLKENIRFFVGQ